VDGAPALWGRAYGGVVSAEELAELDAMYYRVERRWPERPGLDPVLRAKARELAEVLLQDDGDSLAPP